nr:MAG TPA: terminase [Caudoviricetes sp.]
MLPTHKLAVGLDFGFVHDPTALIVFLIGDRDIYIFDEAYQKGLSTKEIAKMIKDKGYSNSLIIGDSAEGRLISELKSEHGIKRLKKSRKGKDSINAGISKIQGFTIHVLPTCENTINELFSYSYQQDKDGRWLNIPKDEDNHLMDAMRYGMQVLDTNRTKKLKRSDIFG